MSYGFIPNETIQFLPVHSGISQSDVDRLHKEYKIIINKLKKKLAHEKSERRFWEERSTTFQRTLRELTIRSNTYPKDAHRALIWNRLHEDGATDELVKALDGEDGLASISMDSEAYFDAADKIIEELEFLRATFYMMREFHVSWRSICLKFIAGHGLTKKNVFDINDKHRAELKLNTFDFREEHKPFEFDVMERDCQERIEDLLDMCTEAANRCEARKIKAVAVKKTCRHLAKMLGLDFESLERRHEVNIMQAVENRFYTKYPVKEARAFVDKIFVSI